MEDGAIRGLVESLHAVVVAASACPNVLVVDSTVEVIEEIGRVSLDVALLIHQFINPPSRARLPFPVSYASYLTLRY